MSVKYSEFLFCLRNSPKTKVIVFVTEEDQIFTIENWKKKNIYCESIMKQMMIYLCLTNQLDS